MNVLIEIYDDYGEVDDIIECEENCVYTVKYLQDYDHWSVETKEKRRKKSGWE